MYDMLCMIDSPCGNEESVKKFIKTKINVPFHEDAIGNLIAHKEGNGQKLMLYVSIDEDAFLAMNVKGKEISATHLGDKKVNKGDLVSFSGFMGVIDSPEDNLVKLLKEYDVNQGDCSAINIPSYEDDGILFSKEAASKLVISAMCEAMDKDNDVDVYFVFGVKSKMGGKGLIAATKSIKPDKLIIFEDTKKQSDKLTIKLMAKGFSSTRSFFEQLCDKNDLCCEVDSKEKTIASLVSCENIAVIGVPVEFKDNIRQAVKLDLKDEILNLIIRSMKND